MDNHAALQQAILCLCTKNRDLLSMATMCLVMAYCLLLLFSCALKEKTKNSICYEKSNIFGIKIKSLLQLLFPVRFDLY